MTFVNYFNYLYIGKTKPLVRDNLGKYIYIYFINVKSEKVTFKSRMIWL